VTSHLSLKVVLTFIRKEFRQLSRTPEMLFLILGAPLIQLLILGFAVTNEVKHVKLYIEDRDNTQVSQSLGRSFTNTDRFDLVENRDNQPSAELIRDWKAQLIVTIPPGFARDLVTGGKPGIGVRVDGMDGNSAAVALSYAQGIVTLFINSELNTPIKFPPDAPMLAALPPQVHVQERMWYNEDLNSTQYMIPGIVAILMTIISMMLAAMSLVKEKEIGTLEQLLVTPVRKSELLLGKLIPYWLLSLFEICFVMLAAHFIFGIHFAGNVLTMGLLAAIYLLTTLGLGILVSTLTRTQQQAMFFAWFMMVFMLLLSGFFIPIRNMPQSIRYLTLLNPMAYFMTIIREIVIKGNELKYLWKEALALIVYGVAIFSFSAVKFKKTTK
jgi:ABC-2 type transport system permease protein